jgi:hypothetical protein
MPFTEPDFFHWDLKAFVRTVFGPPAYGSSDPGEKDWSEWQAQFSLLSMPGEDYDPDLMLRHASAFCREARAWMESYSGPAFSQGCFWLFSEHGPIGDTLYMHPGGAESKRTFISSIPELYKQLATWKDEAVLMALFGLWDSLCYGFKSGRHEPMTDELLMLREACKDALVRQLNTPDVLAQDAALHGFNHLAHPEGVGIILAWVETHPDLEKSRKDYAQQCAAGKAL